MWHTYHWATDPCSPLVWLLAAFRQHIRTSMQIQGCFSGTKVTLTEGVWNFSEAPEFSRFIKHTRSLQSHNCRQRHIGTSPIPHTHTVTCRVANIFPRSNLTRNSNEIKCHQCDFSPFLLIVLALEPQMTKASEQWKPLPFLCVPKLIWEIFHTGHLIQASECMMYPYLGGWGQCM